MRWLGRSFRSLFYPYLPVDPLGDLGERASEHLDRLRMLENRVAVTETVLEMLCEVLSKESCTQAAVMSAAQRWKIRPLIGMAVYRTVPQSCLVMTFKNWPLSWQAALACGRLAYV